MILAHEDSSFAEAMPYFGLRLYPSRPQVFLGRAAKREPPCPVEHCTYHFYKDRGREHSPAMGGLWHPPELWTRVGCRPAMAVGSHGPDIQDLQDVWSLSPTPSSDRGAFRPRSQPCSS